MNPLIIFGTGEIAECVHYYFSNDSGFHIAAFSADGNNISSSTFQGLPVVPFEEIDKYFPADSHDMFIAVGYQSLNNLRTQKYTEGRKKGYRFVSYISSKATVWPDLKIGQNCFVGENTVIHPFVTLEDNVFIWSSNLIGHHSYISKNCFISSNVVLGGRVQISESCFLGINSSIKHNVRIAPDCIIGADALILDDTQEGGAYIVESTKLSRIPSSMLKYVITGKKPR